MSEIKSKKNLLFFFIISISLLNNCQSNEDKNKRRKLESFQQQSQKQQELEKIGLNLNKKLNQNSQEKLDEFNPKLDQINNKAINNAKDQNSILSNIVSFEEPKKEQEACVEEMVSGGTYWFFLFMVTFLTLFAGLMSGLTVGYLSVDQLTMELREITGTPQEKEYSKIVLPVLSNRHWLLCTLLLMNSFAMEALPVFLDRIFSRLAAVVISVTLLLIFGEVIPQALCTGPRQIQIAAFCAPLARVLMLVSWPITFWLGKALDIILGEQGKTRYQNADLKALVEMHTMEAIKKLQQEEEQHPYIPKEDIPKVSDKMGLGETEANLILSALEIRDKKASEVMIPFNKIYLINFEEPLTRNKLDEILEKGFSRIPVYKNNNQNDVIGILRIKQLISRDIESNKSLKQLGIHLKLPLVVHPSTLLIDLLREFRKGKSHMAFVTEQVEKLQIKLGLNRTNSMAVENMYLYPIKGDSSIVILGILTLEDVVEHIFNLEILDEDDYDKIKGKNFRNISNLRSNSKINFYLTPEMKNQFINDETNKIKNTIKQGFKNEQNLKENFLNKMENKNLNLGSNASPGYYSNYNKSSNINNLKEGLI